MILIDMDAMCVRYKHQRMKCLTDLMHIEMSHVRAKVVDLIDIKSFNDFTDLELLLLHKNLCGQKFVGGRTLLKQTVYDLCLALPESAVNGIELTVQALRIAMDDDSFFAYQPKSIYPKPLEEAYNAPALTAVLGAAPIQAPAQAVTAPPSPASQAAAPLPSAPASPVKYPAPWLKK